MNSPLVSVLMCSYNREKYINEAITSVLASTFTNFELIIVDNCSTDNTLEIAKSFESKDTRIKVYQNNTNIGQFPNRNLAAQYAKGKYLKYLDSDDLLFANGLETMVVAMEKFPEAGLGVSYYFKNNLINVDELPTKISGHDAYLMHYLHGGLLFPGPSFTIYKTEWFNKVNSFNPGFGISSDTHLNLKIATLTPVVIFDNTATFWRTHQEQLTITNNVNSLLIEKYKLNEDILNNDNNPLFENEKKIIYFSLRTINARNILIKYLLRFKLKDYKKINNYFNIKLYEFILCLVPLKLSKRLFFK